MNFQQPYYQKRCLIHVHILFHMVVMLFFNFFLSSMGIFVGKYFDLSPKLSNHRYQLGTLSGVSRHVDNTCRHNKIFLGKILFTLLMFHMYFRLRSLKITGYESKNPRGIIEFSTQMSPLHCIGSGVDQNSNLLDPMVKNHLFYIGKCSNM